MRKTLLALLLATSVCDARTQDMKKVDKNHIPPYSEAAQWVVVGGTYQHYKGPFYVILSVARHSETLEELVVYQALYGANNIWVRPLGMFLEDVLVDGQPQPRFRHVDNH